jgi:Flp pilus assembly protein TadD
LTLAICATIAAMTAIVFSRTWHYEFINYDDLPNIPRNEVVREGLTASGIGWAFTHPQVAHWLPLTTLSHMAVCEFFGLQPGAHHLANVGLHAIAAVLLFLVLRRMTSATWRSALVAALFAIHPLRVESVAWVSERKDVLSGIFLMLTIGAYLRYARNPMSLASYLLVAALFACGLMCKSMLVTLPFVLLLLDYWPLRRFPQWPSLAADAAPARDAGLAWATCRRLVLEKIPLFFLSAAAAVAQILAAEETLATVSKLPMAARLGNALVSYAVYVGQIFYPVNLAAIYPHPGSNLPFWQPTVALVVLATLSAGVIAGRKQHPYLVTGWLWYLGMLVPVSGLIQSGNLARADRYTYLPHIGLYLLLVWSAAECVSRMRVPRWLVAGLATLILGSLMTLAATQTSRWRDDETLWNYTLAVTGPNPAAHNNLGQMLGERGRIEEAIPHFQKALEIDPRLEEARSNLGHVHLAQGRADEAMLDFLKMLQLRPSSAEAHAYLGDALMQQDRVDPAIRQYRKALELKPNWAAAACSLGVALLQSGQSDEAILHLSKALELQPHFAEAQANLAWVMATSPEDSVRNGSRAVELAQRANRTNGGGNPMMLRILAAAYAEAGRFSEAAQTAQRASQIAASQSDPMLAERLRAQTQLYQSGQPLRVPVLAQTQPRRPLE